MPQRDRRLWIVVGFAAVVVALFSLALAHGGSGTKPAARPPAVQPVPPGSSPSKRARNLAAWLADHSK